MVLISTPDRDFKAFFKGQRKMSIQVTLIEPVPLEMGHLNYFVYVFHNIFKVEVVSQKYVSLSLQKVSPPKT